MKQLSRIASAVALAAGLFASSQASATTICSNCLYTAAGATFLGAHNANTFDISGFRREIPGVAVLTHVIDTWVFDLFPVGANAQVNASFIPIIPSAFSNFTINLFSAAGSTCALGMGNSLGTAGFCSAVGLGPLLGTSVAFTGGANLFPVPLLAAGRYAFQVEYDANVLPVGQQSTYSGQLTISRLPEPGSLALVGLALVAAAAGLRSSRKA